MNFHDHEQMVHECGNEDNSCKSSSSSPIFGLLQTLTLPRYRFFVFSTHFRCFCNRIPLTTAPLTAARNDYNTLKDYLCASLSCIQGKLHPPGTDRTVEGTADCTFFTMHFPSCFWPWNGARREAGCWMSSKRPALLHGALPSERHNFTIVPSLGTQEELGS